jgi:hypothetical protein
VKSCFKILGGSIVSGNTPSRYRGVFRSLPAYTEEAGAESEVNRAFANLCEKGGQSGCLADLGEAQAIVAAYSRAGVSQHFDLVRITPATDKHSNPAGVFLGFDVAVAGTGFSLLSWDLQLSRYAASDALSPKLKPLIDLTERYFSERLNENGLFRSSDDARFFLSCMAALQELRPNLWESHEMNTYEIVAVCLLNNPAPPV